MDIIQLYQDQLFFSSNQIIENVKNFGTVLIKGHMIHNKKFRESKLMLLMKV